MPSKAAQVLGTTPSRKPRRVQTRPIKSARVLKTPTKILRSDTAKLLPAKVYANQSTRIHYNSASHADRTVSRELPGREEAAANSFESIPPPTPPAKDTPPEFRAPANPPSPLRRAPSHGDLRESYGGMPDRGMQVQLQFPMFALSPSPPKTAIHGDGGVSPTKFRPYTADEYSELIEGEALQWPYPEEDGVSEMKEGGRSAPLAIEGHGRLQFPLSSRSDDEHYNARLGRRLSPLPPRFYSPSNRSVQLFNEGESPSQNVSERRAFCFPLLPLSVGLRT